MNIMKPKLHKILEIAVEQGVRRGYRRSFKYNDSPSEEDILSNIETSIMGEIYEYFSFENYSE